jgi:hypothetical protein
MAFAAIYATHVYLAVTGSFVHAHDVVVDTVRFAAFIAVSPVLPGTAIDNSQSGVMQLRECQCRSSLRFGCCVVGSAVVDCRSSCHPALQNVALALLTSLPAGAAFGRTAPKLRAQLFAPLLSMPKCMQQSTGATVLYIYPQTPTQMYQRSWIASYSSPNTTSCWKCSST